MFDSLFAILFKYSPYVFQQGEFRLAASSPVYIAVALAAVVALATVLTYRSAPGDARLLDRAVLMGLRLGLVALVAVPWSRWPVRGAAAVLALYLVPPLAARLVLDIKPGLPAADQLQLAEEPFVDILAIGRLGGRRRRGGGEQGERRDRADHASVTRWSGPTSPSGSAGAARSPGAGR